MKTENKMIINFKQQLVEGFNKPELVDFINENDENFVFAMNLALSVEQPYAWRSTWVLNHSVKNKDQRLTKYTEKILSNLHQLKDGHQREFLKLLEKTIIDDDNEGFLFDNCMTIWEDVDKIPSVRIVAFKIIINIAEKYPELINEIDFITQTHYVETLSPGIKNSLYRQKKRLDILSEKNKKQDR